MSRGVQSVTATGLEEHLGDLLRRASSAETAGARAKYATQGLAQVGADRTTRAMLLRQLYLSHMEAERFGEAAASARSVVELGVLSEVAFQDWARAELGRGQWQAAVALVRQAARSAPASRRSFHWWTLGCLLYLGGHSGRAADAFEKALRWANGSRPLYRAQLALARFEPAWRQAGATPGGTVPASDAAGATAPGGSAAAEQPHWGGLRSELADSACGGGYGQFVLGLMAERQGDARAARSYLSAFCERVAGGRAALRVGLRAELEQARNVLTRLIV